MTSLRKSLGDVSKEAQAAVASLGSAEGVVEQVTFICSVYMHSPSIDTYVCLPIYEGNVPSCPIATTLDTTYIHDITNISERYFVKAGRRRYLAAIPRPLKENRLPAPPAR